MRCIIIITPTCFFYDFIFGDLVVAVIVWLWDLQLPMQSVAISTDIVSSNLDQGEVYNYNIMWSNLSVTCDRSVVFSESSGFLQYLILSNRGPNPQVIYIIGSVISLMSKKICIYRINYNTNNSM
jgi:hypothetical protein